MLGKTETLAVLGCGTMGEAIVRGLLRSGKLEPSQIFATDRRAEVVRALKEKHGVRTGSDNREACQAAAVVIVCVKPHEVEPLLADPALAALLTGKLVVSIAAGVRLDQLAGLLPKSAVVRAMPNTPCLIGEGMTVIARGPGVTDAQAATALEIFRCVGGCLEAEDKVMDAVTSLNGSGPAFAYIILEALSDGGVRMGLRRDVAMQIAAQRGIYAFGQDSDMIKFGPKAQLTAIIDNWAPYYLQRTNDAIAGTWKSTDTWGGLSSKLVVMAPYTNMPDDVKALAEKTEAAIAAGTLHPFKCPVVDQDGKTVECKGGTHLDDGQILSMNFYVKGVDDKIPGK